MIRMLRIFERLDEIEEELRKQSEINICLLQYVEADLAQTWQESANVLVQKLRAVTRRDDSVR